MRNVRYLTLLAVMLLLLSACGGGGEAEPVAEPEPVETEDSAVDPEDVDDVLTAEEDVPEAIRARAAEVLAVLGEGLTCSAWYWDAEDNAWECEIAAYEGLHAAARNSMLAGCPGKPPTVNSRPPR